MKLPNLKEASDRTKKEIKYKEIDLDYSKIVSDKKYFVRTYGCQMNTHDSESIKYFLDTLGFSETEILEEADVVVLNTCAIRENAKDKLFGFLSRAKHLKENTKPNLVIVLCGCLMQVTDETIFVSEKHKYVDIVIGTHNIEDLPKYIIEKYKNIKEEVKNTQDINVLSNSEEIINDISYKRDSDYTAWVNITFGCDNFCTYCIVPYARGRERSRKVEDIIKEVENLKEKGYKEVTLLGQNVNSYGNDLGIKFSYLLSKVAETNIDRIRFMTSNPWNFSEDTIDVISKYDNIMPYVHLPVQSGSTKILKSMNRKITKEEYIELFNNIKNKVKNVSITTDIIVGFPGETKEDFEETIDLVNTCKFDGAFTFIYSKRAGTPAASMEDNTPIEEKENRLYKLNELVNSYSLMNNKKLIGKTVNVLILGLSDKDKTKVYGHTDTMKTVKVSGALDKIGQIIKVEITDAKSFAMEGKIKK